MQQHLSARKVAGALVVVASAAVCFQCGDGGGLRARCEVKNFGDARTETLSYTDAGVTIDLVKRTGDLAEVHIRVMVDGKLYEEIDAKEGVAEVAFGEMFRIRKARFAGRKDGEQLIVDGTLDGRTLETIRTSTPTPVRYADGAPVDAGVSEGVDAKVRAAVRAAVAEEETACAETGLETGLGTRSVPGVTQNPENQLTCILCLGNCLSNSKTCTGFVLSGCAGLLAIPLFGPGLYFLCVTIGTGVCLGALNTCRGNCRQVGKDCCPIACGFLPGAPPIQQCCNAGGECLDANNRLCCSAGFGACNGGTKGGECCEKATETCLPKTNCCINDRVCTQGNLKTCCPGPVTPITGSYTCFQNKKVEPDCCAKPQVVCADKCCQPGADCFSVSQSGPPECGKCPTEVCGLDPPAFRICCPQGQACADKPTAKCCIQKTICTNGTCCNANETCIIPQNNLCCPDGSGGGVNQVCGGGSQCCRGGVGCLKSDLVPSTTTCCDTNVGVPCGGTCCDDPNARTCQNPGTGQCGP